MKQSKHEYDEIIRSIEERGAAREREKYVKELQFITGGLLAITNKLAALGGIDCTVEVQRNAFAKEKPQPKKRKAVVANSAEIDVIGQFFQEVHPPGSTVTIKNIRQSGIKYGPRIIAAACRVLASIGEIEAVGRKGYRLVQKENGLDEAVSAESPTR